MLLNRHKFHWPGKGGEFCDVCGDFASELFVLWIDSSTEVSLDVSSDYHPTEYPFLMKGTCLKDDWLYSVDIYLH